jgi:hypothetical protein
MNLTVIYYTSNRENQEFEKKIRQELLKVIGDIPLISVSQKPLDFGENICVGDIGVSDQNAHRQFQIGAKAAKTKYVCSAEADFLYPREYFEFEPTGDSVYRNENDWVIFCYKKWINYRYNKKPFIIGTQICKREDIVKYGFRENVPFTIFKTEIACISFKTGNSMTNKNRVGERILELPYWGDARVLTNKYV